MSHHSTTTTCPTTPLLPHVPPLHYYHMSHHSYRDHFTFLWRGHKYLREPAIWGVQTPEMWPFPVFRPLSIKIQYCRKYSEQVYVESAQCVTFDLPQKAVLAGQQQLFSFDVAFSLVFHSLIPTPPPSASIQKFSCIITESLQKKKLWSLWVFIETETLVGEKTSAIDTISLYMISLERKG